MKKRKSRRSSRSDRLRSNSKFFTMETQSLEKSWRRQTLALLQSKKNTRLLKITFKEEEQLVFRLRFKRKAKTWTISMRKRLRLCP